MRPRKIASVKKMGRKSGAPSGFDLAVCRSDENGSFTDDRPLVRGFREHARKRLSVRGIEPIDVGPLGREALLDFRAQSAAPRRARPSVSTRALTNR